MVRKTSKLTKIAGALALIFALFSAGVTIVNQCHQEAALASDHASHGEHVSSLVPVEAAPISQTLTTTFCTSIFFIVLILFSRRVLVALRGRYLKQSREMCDIGRVLALQWQWRSRLTLPELGLLRI